MHYILSQYIFFIVFCVENNYVPKFLKDRTVSDIKILHIQIIFDE